MANLPWMMAKKVCIISGSSPGSGTDHSWLASAGFAEFYRPKSMLFYTLEVRRIACEQTLKVVGERDEPTRRSRSPSGSKTMIGVCSLSGPL